MVVIQVVLQDLREILQDLRVVHQDLRVVHRDLRVVHHGLQLDLQPDLRLLDLGGHQVHPEALEPPETLEIRGMIPSGASLESTPAGHLLLLFTITTYLRCHPLTRRLKPGGGILGSLHIGSGTFGSNLPSMATMQLYTSSYNAYL